MDGVITRRVLLKGGLIAGALVPVAGLFISGAAHADLPALDPSDPAARGRDGGFHGFLRAVRGKERSVRRVVQRVGEDRSPLM
jgi:hypothetical protein